MLGLVGRLLMYYGIIAQIVFRHIPGCTTTTPSTAVVPFVHNNFSTIELNLIFKEKSECT